MSRAVNWLWFTSLLLALAVALLGILIKQWIVEYNARNAASAESPRHWAIRHQLFFQAMTGWPVADLVSVLPVMLHASLFLFFGGVALFVWDLDRGIGAWVAILGLALGGFYVACSLIPLWIPECPTATPVVNLIRRTIVWLRISILRTGIVLYPRSHRVYEALCHHRLFRQPANYAHPENEVVHTRLQHNPRDVYSVRNLIDPPGQLPRMTDAQDQTAVTVARWAATIIRLDVQSTPRSILTPILDRRRCDLEGDALLWLNFSVSDSDSTAVALQAIGGVHPTSALATYLRNDPKLKSMTWSDASARFAMLSHPVENMRVVRSMLVLDIHRDAPGDWEFPFYGFLYNLGQYPDMRFMRYIPTLSIPGRGMGEPPPSARSPSLTSTVLLFLRYWRQDLTDLLRSLLWCDFGSSAFDWDCVIDRVISAAPRKLGALRSSSQPLVLLDLLAQLWRPETENDSEIQRLIIRILAAQDLLVDIDIYMSPYLLNYVASGEFARQSVPASALACIDYALSYLPSYPTSVHTLQTALLAQSVSLSVRLRTPSSPWFRWPIDLCHEILSSAMPDRRPVTGGVPLATALRWILQPIHSQTVTLSLWDMIRNLGIEPNFGLVEDLIRCLCIAERYNYDVSDMVDAVLARITLQDLLRMFESGIEGGYTFRIYSIPIHFAHLVQHCIELRPTWWLATLNTVIDDDSVDEGLRTLALDIDREVSTRGPCLACPGVPLGWDDQDCLPSSSAFDQATALDLAPGVSTKPSIHFAIPPNYPILSPIRIHDG